MAEQWTQWAAARLTMGPHQGPRGDSSKSDSQADVHDRHLAVKLDDDCSDNVLDAFLGQKWELSKITCHSRLSCKDVDHGGY